MKADVQHKVSAVAPVRMWQRLACCLGVYSFFLGGYAILNRSIPASTCWDFTTALDRDIPFVPEFIWPFHLAYVAVLVPSLLVPDRRALLRTTAAFVVLVSISFLLFVLVPVTVPRAATLPDSLSGHLIRQ